MDAVDGPASIEVDLSLYCIIADCPRGAFPNIPMVDSLLESKFSNIAEFGSDSTKVTI